MDESNWVCALDSLEWNFTLSIDKGQCGRWLTKGIFRDQWGNHHAWTFTWLSVTSGETLKPKVGGRSWGRWLAPVGTDSVNLACSPLRVGKDSTLSLAEIVYRLVVVTVRGKLVSLLILSALVKRSDRRPFLVVLCVLSWAAWHYWMAGFLPSVCFGLCVHPLSLFISLPSIRIFSWQREGP